MTYNNIKKEDLIKVLADFNSKCENDKEYQIDFNEQKKKRSLNANSYFWVLCNKLAEKIGDSPTGIYIKLIQCINKSYIEVLVNKDSVESFRALWQSKGIGWILTIEEQNVILNTDKVRLYYGSSAYSNEQMSLLIDLIIKICKKHNIDTLSENELNNLKSLWKTKGN